MTCIGEAWYIEEDSDSGVPLSPTSGVTIGHMDHALLPQKLYFSTSPPPPPAPVVYHTSSTSQPTPVTSGRSGIIIIILNPGTSAAKSEGVIWLVCREPLHTVYALSHIMIIIVHP